MTIAGFTWVGLCWCQCPSWNTFLEYHPQQSTKSISSWLSWEAPIRRWIDGAGPPQQSGLSHFCRIYEISVHPMPSAGNTHTVFSRSKMETCGPALFSCVCSLPESISVLTLTQQWLAAQKKTSVLWCDPAFSCESQIWWSYLRTCSTDWRSSCLFSSLTGFLHNDLLWSPSHHHLIVSYNQIHLILERLNLLFSFVGCYLGYTIIR